MSPYCFVLRMDLVVKKFPDCYNIIVTKQMLGKYLLMISKKTGDFCGIINALSLSYCRWQIFSFFFCFVKELIVKAV